jgi:hypothetical protein
MNWLKETMKDMWERLQKEVAELRHVPLDLHNQAHRNIIRTEAQSDRYSFNRNREHPETEQEQSEIEQHDVLGLIQEEHSETHQGWERDWDEEEDKNQSGTEEQDEEEVHDQHESEGSL